MVMRMVAVGPMAKLAISRVKTIHVTLDGIIYGPHMPSKLTTQCRVKCFPPNKKTVANAPHVAFDQGCVKRCNFVVNGCTCALNKRLACFTTSKAKSECTQFKELVNSQEAALNGCTSACADQVVGF